MPWLFLFAYTCSGLAGLIYEVSWTRLLTLYVGHTTAAASAVVGAFLGGLATGAAVGGRLATPLTRRQSLMAYAALEFAVAAAALLIPLEIRALTPLLQWAYDDGQSSALFPLVRLASCLLMVFVPAAALGSTFPVATRWFAAESADPARASGWLYALNTAGAAVGALLAGFVLIPASGLTATVGVGVGASTLAAVVVLSMIRRGEPVHVAAAVSARSSKPATKNRDVARHVSADDRGTTGSPAWLAAGVLGLTGFASLSYEIVWTRVLALVLGPTIYAFAATLAAVIGGVAIGSAAGAAVVGRTRQPAAWLAAALIVAAVSTTITSSLAGTTIPRIAAEQLADTTRDFTAKLSEGMALTAALILPTAVALGAAFPLALGVAGAARTEVTRRFAAIYAANTIGAVSGSLAAGFYLIPALGLQTALTIVSLCLVAAALAVIVWASRERTARTAGVLVTAAVAVLLALTPDWDRELLASGAYLYAPFVPKDLDLPTLLKAGTLLYYREGASSTVSVKRLTGTTTLAVDGKTDASNRGDMLTQKLVAHLPLLLHDEPRDVGIIGLGSGVTLGAALRHPIARADVVEISQEVVEASRFFEAENRHALADQRTRLIVGDGRSHLLLTRQRYDVIISEPSNPWIAGVAALFTQEFFQTARERLAPGGIICQWANAYTISDADLRAIVATFRTVFPDGTVWLVGTDDVLMVGSTATTPISDRLGAIASNWTRPGVADDLKTVRVADPFSVLSLFAGGPGELSRYTANAAVLTDDRMTLEFSGPREIHRRASDQNSAALTALLDGGAGPGTVRAVRASATAAQWRDRAAMMSGRDAHTVAYDDYAHALGLNPLDQAALDGLVRTAVLLRRGSDAITKIAAATSGQSDRPDTIIAISKLLASTGAAGDAVAQAQRAVALAPGNAAAMEQLASLFADAGNVTDLTTAVERLRAVAPSAPATRYYQAVLALLGNRPEEAIGLANETVALDPNYAPVYDLLGAAHTKVGHVAEARAAFEQSLGFDAHDSSAYTNLGLLELAAGNRDAAAHYFAEALWLAPDSPTAREGLSRARD